MGVLTQAREMYTGLSHGSSKTTIWPIPATREPKVS